MDSNSMWFTINGTINNDKIKVNNNAKPTPKCYRCGEIGHWACYDHTEVIPKLEYTTT